MRNLLGVVLVGSALMGLSHRAFGQPQQLMLRARTGLPSAAHDARPGLWTGPRGGVLLEPSTRDEQGSLALTVTGSVLLGTAGAVLGGLVGGALSDGCNDFLCELEGVALGFLIATPIGTATGAHLGNGRRGSFGVDLLGAAVGLGVGIAIWAGDSDSFLVFLLGVVPAVGAPVFAERRSARRNAQRRIRSAAVVPTADGVAFGVRLALN